MGVFLGALKGLASAGKAIAETSKYGSLINPSTKPGPEGVTPPSGFGSRVADFLEARKQSRRRRTPINPWRREPEDEEGIE